MPRNPGLIPVTVEQLSPPAVTGWSHAALARKHIRVFFTRPVVVSVQLDGR